MRHSPGMHPLVALASPSCTRHTRTRGEGDRRNQQTERKTRSRAWPKRQLRRLRARRPSGGRRVELGEAPTRRVFSEALTRPSLSRCSSRALSLPPAVASARTRPRPRPNLSQSLRTPALRDVSLAIARHRRDTISTSGALAAKAPTRVTSGWRRPHGSTTAHCALSSEASRPPRHHLRLLPPPR